MKGRISNSFFNAFFDIPESFYDKMWELKSYEKGMLGFRDANELLEPYCGNEDMARAHPSGALIADGVLTRTFNKHAISSHDGKINKILLTYPAYNEYQKGQELFVFDLFEKMPDIHFCLLTPVADPRLANTLYDNDSPLIYAYKDLKRILDTFPNVNVEFINSRSDVYTIWAQDAFIPLKHDNKLELVEPFYFERNYKMDRAIPEALVKHNENDITRTRVTLCFQGGNVLIGDEFILVGKDSIERSKNLYKKYYSEINVEEDYLGGGPEKDNHHIVDYFRNVLGRNKKIIEIGSRHYLQPPKDDLMICDVLHLIGYGIGVYQPLFHIDLFITLVGYCQQSDYSDKYIILVGQLTNVTHFTHPDLEEQYFDPIRERLSAIVNQLENIRDKSGELMFEIRRIPLPITYVVDIDSRRYNDVWHWRPLSYNNCLVENTSTSAKVWLPTYSEPIYYNPTLGRLNFKLLRNSDEKIKEIWEDLGFDVITLRNYFPLMVMGGAVHCITKYLDRD